MFFSAEHNAANNSVLKYKATPSRHTNEWTHTKVEFNRPMLYCKQSYLAAAAVIHCSNAVDMKHMRTFDQLDDSITVALTIARSLFKTIATYAAILKMIS